MIKIIYKLLIKNMVRFNIWMFYIKINNSNLKSGINLWFNIWIEIGIKQNQEEINILKILILLKNIKSHNIINKFRINKLKPYIKDHILMQTILDIKAFIKIHQIIIMFIIYQYFQVMRQF